MISGLPGAGKTTYARWLEAQGWRRFSSDDQEPRSIARAIVQAINGDDSSLLAEGANKAGLVIEWGFPPASLPKIERLIAHGYDAWYFDGDRPTALENWKAAHPGAPEHFWHDQVAGLDAHDAAIRRLYGRRLITTIRAGGEHLSPAEIHSIIRPPRMEARR